MIKWPKFVLCLNSCPYVFFKNVDMCSQLWEVCSRIFYLVSYFPMSDMLVQSRYLTTSVQTAIYCLLNIHVTLRKNLSAAWWPIHHFLNSQAKCSKRTVLHEYNSNGINFWIFAICLWRTSFWREGEKKAALGDVTLLMTLNTIHNTGLV